MEGSLIVALNRPISVDECKGFVRTCFSFLQGSVVVCSDDPRMQEGVDFANKLAYEKGRSVLVTREMEDALELFRPDKVLWLNPRKSGALKVFDVADDLKLGKTVMLVFGDRIEGKEILMELPLDTPQAAAVVLYQIHIALGEAGTQS